MSERVYPMEYEKCPNCGCKERVVEVEVNAEKALGKIPQDRFAASNMKFLPIVDAIAGNYISAPVLTVFEDICAECGKEYPHYITRQVMPRHQIEALLGISR
jgi:rRNA maturation protein Nop10